MADRGLLLTKTSSGSHAQCCERSAAVFAGGAATGGGVAAVFENECLHVEVSPRSAEGHCCPLGSQSMWNFSIARPESRQFTVRA